MVVRMCGLPSTKFHLTSLLVSSVFFLQGNATLIVSGSSKAVVGTTHDQISDISLAPNPTTSNSYALAELPLQLE